MFMLYRVSTLLRSELLKVCIAEPTAQQGCSAASPPAQL